MVQPLACACSLASIVHASLTANKGGCDALRNARARSPPAWCYQLVAADCEAHYIRQNGRARRCIVAGERCVAGPPCHRSAAAAAATSAPSNRGTSGCIKPTPAQPGIAEPSLCLLLARWGGWPGWFALILRTMELNPTVQFHLLGDKPPKTTLPRNTRFHRVRSSELVSRVRAATGVRPPKFALTGWGHTAKVNDIKPLFGLLFAELLQNCEWWATMQDDMLLGSVRSFLSAELLARHDLVSPLPAPFFHSGPFMAYRNTEVVNRLWQRSADWQWMLRTPEYVTFDEWWGPAADKDNMPHVVHREAAAGRVRVYTPPTWWPGRQRWMLEDFVHGPNGSRWFDESLAVVWRRGRLRAGERAGGMQRRACDELLYAHFMHAKRREPVAAMPPTGWLSRLAAATDEISLTPHGIWVRAHKASSPEAAPPQHWLVSGRSPRAVAAVSSSELRRHLSNLTRSQPAETAQPVALQLLGLRGSKGEGPADSSNPITMTARHDWLLTHRGVHAKDVLPCASTVGLHLHAQDGELGGACSSCDELVRLSHGRLSMMRTPCSRTPLSELLRLSCSVNSGRTCAATITRDDTSPETGMHCASRGPASVRPCTACAAVHVGGGVPDLSCCHVPGGGWAERCGELVGEATCGDDGRQTCEFTWLEGWQACNHHIDTAVDAVVRSTIGFADGWAAAPTVPDLQAFATRTLGAPQGWTTSAEGPLQWLAAFAHGLPMRPCPAGKHD